MLQGIPISDTNSRNHAATYNSKIHSSADFFFFFGSQCLKPTEHEKGIKREAKDTYHFIATQFDHRPP
jgi:hypothetical protein